MIELLKILIAICVLFLGIPIGKFLAQQTKEELKSGQKWFKLIISACILLSVISLFIGNDSLLFSSLFIAIVTAQSLKSK